MFNLFVWFSNFLGAFSIALFCYKFIILQKAKKENTLTSEMIFKKLKFCSYYKALFIAFIVMKAGLIWYSFQFLI